MWEARAAEGRGAELLEWARAQAEALPGGGGGSGTDEDPGPGAPLRRETFRAPQDRVLVLTWWETAEGLSAELPELPDPDPGLITRPVHRWRFESVACT
ncbi:hypothetical protein ACFVQ4_11815 [Streptomyces laurentii]|uniref:hypothetical protein n=1 Tax=Streptomyces laurentii TaxID=39478 RepID=UPI0036A7659C